MIIEEFLRIIERQEENGINTSSCKVEREPDFKEFIPKISSKEGVVE